MPRPPSHRFNGPYKGAHLEHVAMPMGGLGAGMIQLNGNGGFSGFCLHHKPGLMGAETMFGCLHVAGDKPVTRLLEGPIPRDRIFGGGIPDGPGNHPLHGVAMPSGANSLPRFRQAEFEARFPFGHVRLSDEDMPVRVELTGWSPFVPGDVDAGSLPVIGLEYTFTNPTATHLDTVFSFHAFNPAFAHRAWAKQGRITKRPNGLAFHNDGSEAAPHDEGHVAIDVLDHGATTDAAWFRGGWHDTMTMLWRNVAAGKRLDRPPHEDAFGPSVGGSLYVPLRLPAGESRTVTLAITWYMPVSDQWEPRYTDLNNCAPAGSYTPWHIARFPSLEATADHWHATYRDSRARTEAFTNDLYDTTLPPEILEAVGANLYILKSPTVLRQHDGRLYGWEGCFDHTGSCWGSCSHVWNYAQALPHLFPELERGLRETEFLVNQDESGHQSFRGELPIREPRHNSYAAADGQLGGIVKLHREWRICGDTDWLRSLWPKARESLDYCILTWDPDHNGLVSEPHHNTYDIEFWGPDGMCTSFYLAALKAAAVMGEALGDDVNLYHELYARGRQAMESELWNGEYFIQKVMWKELHHADPVTAAEDEGVMIKPVYDPESLELLEEEGPKYQYGPGCLSDGVIGDWLARCCLLGPILDEDKVRSHLRAVHRYNFRASLHDHACTVRPGFAIEEEAGLLLCSWPHGGRPSLPFVYADEVWTGIEYQVAAHLMMLGCTEEGLEIVRGARSRYDGRVRNPFNEYECGGWYARAMSSYSLLQGYQGHTHTPLLETTPEEQPV
ncbi:MAG: hypothetical protein HQ523_12515 [Lentisphaerae bacterium]|nr:hypothetical protein [Lentisphaerota bacterium]